MKEEKLAVKDLKISGYGLVTTYEWCIKKMQENCTDPVLGLAIAVNSMLLEKPYKELMDKLWDERNDERWNEWRRAEYGVAEKYADRDNNGEIVKDPSGRAVVTEQAVEASKELENLKNNEFKEFWELFDAKKQENAKLLTETNQLRVCCIQDWNVKIDDITPNVLAVIMGDTVKELLNI